MHSQPTHRGRHASILTLACLALTTAVRPQLTWTDRTSRIANPPARSGIGIVYDAARKRIVLVQPGAKNHQSVWTWDGAKWTDVTPATGNPLSRTDFSVCYDSRRRVLVMTFDGPELRTWEWDGARWSDRTLPTGNPPGRGGHASTYDVARGQVIVFGGLGRSSSFNDTWAWDGKSWTRLASGPARRHRHALAYDAARRRVVLFGGTEGPIGNRKFGDTWEWDGARWIERKPVTRPSPRHSHALAYDAARQRVVLFGGGRDFSIYTDTWEWDGTSWRERTPKIGSPPGRIMPAMAYDAARKAVVLYAGYAGKHLTHTWIYRTSAPGGFTTFGAGCRGSAGVPALANRGSWPLIGETFRVGMGPIPPAARSALVWIGAARASVRLDGLGMPGCTLLAAPDLPVSVPARSGTAEIAWSLPADPRLVHARFFLQGRALDPSANALGVVTSNGAAAVVGRW